ncbi:MAG: DUF3772 domain-containing protein [Xenophilus sp.]
MHWILRPAAAFPALAFSLLLALAVPAGAQVRAPASVAPAASQAPFDTGDLRAQLDKLPASADTAEQARSLVQQVDAIAEDAGKFIAQRTSQLNDLNARLGELGDPPSAGATEAPDITRQRATLTLERNAVDADIRLARLVMVDAQQRANELLNKRRADFEAQLTERAASPLTADFWRDIANAWPEDVQRLQPLADELHAGASRAAQKTHRGPVLGALALALLTVTLGNLLAERLLVRLARRVLPAGRLRRSLLVIAIVAANLLLVGLAVHGLLFAFDAHGLLGEQTRKLARVAQRTLLFMTFVVGLGRSLLANARPSWRLPPIADPMARRLRAFPALTALVSAVVWVPTQINALVDASYAAVVAAHATSALALSALIAAMLMRLRGPRAAPAETHAKDEGAEAEAAASRPLWVGALRGLVALTLVVIVVLVALGYVALASTIAGQLTWTGIVACAFYVLFKFTDDLCMTLLGAGGASGRTLTDSFGLPAATLNQAAVLLSGALRLVLFFYMVVTLIAPLGTAPGEIVQRSSQFGTGLKVGEFEIVPAALLGALSVLVVGFIGLRVLRHWLESRYFPATTLEPGMRSSIATLLGYVGAVVVVAFALSALGIGVNRIAWIASALSVGIGFGLQAIVQNFISGLILLVERPVKVGDWVALGGTEGDIRRINVRATEIQLGDRSTVIVPNSEFITKTVRNMTLANAGGRVLLRLPMPLGTDTRRVRELMLAAFKEHPLVLAAPAPSVTLQDIDQGRLIFQGIAYVGNPRQADAARSDLLFALLDNLRQAGLPLTAPTLTMAVPPPAAADGPA